MKQGDGKVNNMKTETNGMRVMEDICVCCGEPVPEGRMVCWKCEHQFDQARESSTLSKGENDNSHSNQKKHKILKIKLFKPRIVK